MPMVADRLRDAVKTDFLTQLQAAFPIDAGLLPAEQAAIAQEQQKLALALGVAVGPNTVTEVESATVEVSGVTPGGGTAVGVVS